MLMSNFLSLYGVKIKKVPGTTDNWYYTINSKVYTETGLYNSVVAKAYDNLLEWLSERDGDVYENAADLYEE